MQVTKQFRTETAHRLMNHPGLCKNLHGHSYLFEVTIEGAVKSASGMVLDFKDLKTALEAVIGAWDHAVLLQDSDPLIKALEGVADFRVIVTPMPPTAEWMAGYIASVLRQYNGLPVVAVKVWETTTSYAEWNLHSERSAL